MTGDGSVTTGRFFSCHPRAGKGCRRMEILAPVDRVVFGPVHCHPSRPWPVRGRPQFQCPAQGLQGQRGLSWVTGLPEGFRLIVTPLYTESGDKGPFRLNKLHSDVGTMTGQCGLIPLALNVRLAVSRRSASRYVWITPATSTSRGIRRPVALFPAVALQCLGEVFQEAHRESGDLGSRVTCWLANSG